PLNEARPPSRSAASGWSSELSSPPGRSPRSPSPPSSDAAVTSRADERQWQVGDGVGGTAFAKTWRVGKAWGVVVQLPARRTLGLRSPGGIDAAGLRAVPRRITLVHAVAADEQARAG